MKNLATGLLPLLLVGSCAAAASEVGYRYLGQIKATNPAFISIEKFEGQNDFMLISTFGALVSGNVFVIPDIASKVIAKEFDTITPVKISDGFTWPNKIATVPSDVFGEGVNAISVPDGFLPPGHTNGEVFVITTDPADVSKKTGLYKISAQKSGYFYHSGFWIDVNGDGRKDYLTARTNAGAGKGELVWLEHPENGLAQVPWTDHVIVNGPDVMFDAVEIEAYPGSLIVFAAQFFDKKISVYEISKGAVVNSRVIDDQIDAAYSVKYLDIDGDGKFELLANNHESTNSKAGIFLYSVPSDLFSGSFVKKQIAGGFTNAWSLFGNMCPGFPYPVYPETSLAGKESAHILVAGDGDHSAHLMRPDGNGNYTREVIKNLGGTVGSLTFSDIDNDGWVEFFVPNYDNNYIEVYQFYDATSEYYFDDGFDYDGEFDFEGGFLQSS